METTTTRTRGTYFSQIGMIKFSDALLDYIPITTLEWETLQREKNRLANSLTETKVTYHVETEKGV